MKLSEHFTLEELTKSATAKRLNILNTPNEEEMEKLTTLCKTVLEPIRMRYNRPIVVSSGFRCYKLNDAVGGSKTSQHVKAEAADIHSLSDTREDNKELFKLIKEMIDNGEITVGQLINEYDYDWCHISLGNKNQIFDIK